MGQARRKTKGHVSRRKVMKGGPPKNDPDIGLARESTAVLLVVLAVFMALALYSYQVGPGGEGGQGRAAIGVGENMMGRLGMWLAESLFFLLGWCSFITVIWALLLARTVWVKGWPARTQSVFSLVFSTAASLLMAASCAAIATVMVGYEGGGAVGSVISFALVRYVNEPGTVLLCSAVFLLALGMATGVGTAQLVRVMERSCGYLVRIAVDSCFLVVSLGRAIGKLAVGAVRLTSWLMLGMIRLLGVAGRKCADVLGGILRRPARDKSAGSRKESEEKQPRRIREQSAVPGSEGFVLGDDTLLGERPTGKPIITRRLNSDGNQTGTSVRPLRKKGRGRRQKGDAAAEDAGNGKGDKASEEREYVLPPVELLVSGEGGGVSGPKDTDLIRNSKRLEQTLRNFRIGGRVTEVHPGPVVTLYQFEPAAGVKVQRIISLADDLALALKVASVRVFAPVPGKGTVGIEVPNAQREIVRLREILEHDVFQNHQAPLSMVFGKDTYGDAYIASLAKMPHLLIAGATGTGKSVCINSLLISLLYKNTPNDLRLVLIDPKMLELSVYEEIPHLMAPVITAARRARGVLWWAAQEMERRYKLMKAVGVRDVSMYNRAVAAGGKRTARMNKKRKEKQKTIVLEEKDVIATGSPYEGLERGSELRVKELELLEGTELKVLPRIVIVVDELADLIFTVGREIEELLTRLAQKARAAGIHLILATQRPSVNVITGLIKANFPARISFKVASRIDARTVMDMSGAEKLLGQGDFLFLAPGMGVPRRLHSPYVSDKEVHDVADWLRALGTPDYDTEIEKTIERLDESDAQGEKNGEGGEEYDPLYDQAVNLVIEKGQASTSMVQRVFRIGYNRAARILETMERDGVVGPADGAKPRQVLVGGRGDYAAGADPS